MPAVGRYEIGELLGEGGMGRVYRATHTLTGREVALKVLRSDYRDEGATRGLLQEAAAAARLDHPAIVDLVDLTFDADGSPVLVMELVEGTSVESWIHHWPGWVAVRTGMIEALSGLAAAHAAGVIHRDLKPSNLLLRHDGHVRIADFGIARVANPLIQHSTGGRVLGTPYYMAPEQLERFGDIGPWTDLYAFGTVLWELVHGQLPFDGGLLDLVLKKRLGELPAHEPRPGLESSFELGLLLRRLLDPAPRRRLRFAAEVIDALDGMSVTDSTPSASSRAPAHAVATQPFDLAPASAEIADAVTLHAVDTGNAKVGPTLSLASVRPSLPQTLPPEDLEAPTGGGSLLRLRTPPLVGRADIQHTMLDLAREVCAKRCCRVVALVGAAGVGKSRLARWLLGEVERRGLMEGAAAGYELGGGGTEGGLRHAVASLMGPTRAEWTWQGLPTTTDDLRAWLNGSMPMPEVAAIMAETAIRAVTAVRPVMLWLDDFGWADDGAIPLVERLLEVREPVLVVCTLRAGTAEHPSVRRRLDAILTHDAARVIEIEPLTAAALRELVTEVMPMSDELLTEVVAQMDARPLVALSRLYDLVEEGAVEQLEDGWQPAAGRTVDELLETHSDALFGPRLTAFFKSFGDDSGLAKDLLLRAAALGARFDESLLRATARANGKLAATVGPVVDRALLAGILRFEPGGHAHYQFDHGLLRDHLLDELAAAPERRAIARQVVAAIEGRYAGRRPDLGERTARLLWEAGDHDRAIEAITQASQHVSRNGRFARGEELEQTAWRWLDDIGASADAPSRGSVIYTRAHRLYHAIRYEEALAVIRTAREVLEHSDPVLQARVQLLEVQIAFYSDRFRDAQTGGEALEARLSDMEVTVPVTLARIATQHILMELACMRDDGEEALGFARSGLALARTTGLAWRERFSEVLMYDVELSLGRADHREERLARLLSEAATDDDPGWVTTLEIQLRFDVLHERWDLVRENIEPTIARCVGDSDRWRETGARIVHALLEAEEGTRGAMVDATAMMLDAFEEVPHDEWFSHRALERLADTLSDRSQPALAQRVRSMLESRRASIRRGFGIQ